MICRDTDVVTPTPERKNEREKFELLGLCLCDEVKHIFSSNFSLFVCDRLEPFGLFRRERNKIEKKRKKQRLKATRATILCCHEIFNELGK